MLTPILRIGSELSPGEKTEIINRMFATQNQQERDSVRNALVEQYGVSEGTITSLIAHETMRRMKNGEGTGSSIQSGEISTTQTVGEGGDENPTQVLQESTQSRVYAITTLSELTEEMREDIIEEFGDVIRSSATDLVYDYYLDIEAISDYYNIDPSILEQFLRNRYNWLGAKLDELKKGRILNEEDKMNIRLYVSQGVNDKDKKTRRKEMAKKYGVSAYVIGAITAWKIGEGGGVVLKKDNVIDESKILAALTGKGSKNESEIAIPAQKGQQTGNSIEVDSIVQSPQLEGEETSDYQTSETSIEVIDEGRVEISDDDRIFIQELAGSFDLNNDQQRKYFLDDVFELFPDSTIDDIKKIVPDFLDDEKHTNKKRGGEGMGALMEYDNEIKNKWRQKLKEFIDENTDKQKRATMKVLCLPGMECLEIPLYLELGFRPENIIGVEAGIVKGKKDPEVIARFQANAAKYGIQTRIGKLEKILETEETVFDVVSLDFLSQFGKHIEKNLLHLKIGKRVIILLNFQGKREDNYTRDRLKISQSIHVDSVETLTKMVSGKIPEDFYNRSMSQGLTEARMGTAIPREFTLMLNRVALSDGKSIFRSMNGLLDLISDEFAMSYIANREFQPIFDNYPIDPKLLKVCVLRMMISDLAVKIQHAIAEYLKNRAIAERLGAIIFLACINLTEVYGRNRHHGLIYSGKNTSMVSDFLLFDLIGEDEIKSYKYLHKFLTECLRNIILSERGLVEFEFCDKNNQVARGCKLYVPGHKLRYSINGSIRDEIRLSNINNPVQNYAYYQPNPIREDLDNSKRDKI